MHDAVNKQLHGQTSPVVLPYLKGEIAILPHTLLAALYVHFALELSGRARTARQCPQCENYFIPRRTDQTYCSASCRAAHSYHVNKGKTPKEKA